MPPTIRVMISGRSLTPVFAEGVPLGQVRMRLRNRLERLRWTKVDPQGALQPSQGHRPLFEVWIHESAAGASANASTFEISLREIRRADIVLVLHTGEAGWAVDHREMGICHAELHESLEPRGDVVALFGIEPLHSAQDQRDRSFQAWVNRLNLFRGSAHSEEELGKLVIEHLHDRVAELVHIGASGKRRRDRGQALDWAELELAERRIEMTAALARVLGVDRGFSDQLAQIEIAGTTFSTLDPSLEPYSIWRMRPAADLL